MKKDVVKPSKQFLSAVKGKHENPKETDKKDPRTRSRFVATCTYDSSLPSYNPLRSISFAVEM